MTLDEIIKKSLNEQEKQDNLEKDQIIKKENEHSEEMKIKTEVLDSDGKSITGALETYIEGSKELYLMSKNIENGKDQNDSAEDTKKSSISSGLNTPLISENANDTKVNDAIVPKVEIIINKESSQVVEKIVNASQDKKAFDAFRKKRAAAMKKATLPLPMSNTFITGSPIHSNAIIQAMKPIGENDTEYDRLTRCLNIISDLVEVRGVGAVSQMDLSKLISYLELPIVYYTIYLASTNGTTTLDIPCINPDCSSFAKPYPVTIDNMDIMTVEKPEVYKEYIEKIKSEKNITKMISESDTNVAKHLPLDNGNIIVLKIPSLFDYMQKTLVNINDNNRIFGDILALCPFVQEIRLYDEDKYISLNTFEEIFEELVKYTSDDDLQKINILVEEMVVGKMVMFRLPKEKLVCPHCNKAYTQDIPMEPEQMLFQIPVMRKMQKQ